MGKIRFVVAALALSCAAVFGAGLAFAEPAFAQGRALVCVQQQGMARSASSAAVEGALSGFSWEGLMDVSGETLSAAGIDSPADSSPAARAFGATRDAKIVLVTSDELSTDDLVATLSTREGVLFAEPDRTFEPEELWGDEFAAPSDVPPFSEAVNPLLVDPDRSYEGFQWFLKNNGFWASGKKDFDAGYRLPAQTGKPSIVAVLDSGVSSNHPNLKDRMVDLGRDFPKLKADTKCGDRGFNAVPGEDPTDIEDELGHGTHVAGIVAASSSVEGGSMGVSGISHGTPASIVAIRVSDRAEQTLNTSWILRGYDWLVKANEGYGLGVRAVNVSITGVGITKSEQLAMLSLERAGIVGVFGAGNDARDIDVRDSTGSLDSVASMLVVGAVDSAGSRAPYSNYGQRTTSLFAPGSAVLSSLPDCVARYNAFSAAENTRSSSGGIQSLVYESFEDGSAPDNPDPSIGVGLSFSYAVTGEDGRLVAGEKPDVVSSQWFTGSRSLAVSDSDGDGEIALISDAVDLRAVGKDALYAGLSAFGSAGKSQVYLRYRLKGSPEFSAKTATFAVQADPAQWRTTATAATQKLPDDVDLENFEMLITVKLDKTQPNATVYLDSIGVGSGLERFGVMGGTSMAAPNVTGTIALLASAYPDESSLKLSARILGGATASANLDAYCSTGGYLNVGKALDDPNPALQAVFVEKGKASLSGWFFQEGDEVKVAGIPVQPDSWEVSEEGMVTVRFAVPEGVPDGVNEFAVSSAQGVGRGFFDVGAVNRASGYEDLPIPEVGALDNTRLVATDDAVYLFATPSSSETWTDMYCFDIVQKTWSGKQEIPFLAEMGAFSKEEVSWGTPVEHAGRLYVVANAYLIDQGYQEVTWLVSFDPVSGAWSSTPVLGDALSGAKLVSWNGKLCSVAPSRDEARPSVDAVSYLDPVTGAQEVAGYLPVALGMFDCVTASGDDLVVYRGESMMGQVKAAMYVTDLKTSASFDFLSDFDSALGSSVALVSVQEGVLVIGLGHRSGAIQSDTALFDKETGAWTWTGKLCSAVPSSGLASAQRGGKAYVWGYSGTTPDFYFFRSTEANDPIPTPQPTPAPSPSPGPSPLPTSDPALLAKAGDPLSGVAAAFALLALAAVIAVSFAGNRARS